MATAGHTIADFLARVRETDFARASRFEVRFQTPGVLGVGGDTREISLMVEDGLFPGILVGTRPFRINNLNEQRANVIDFGGDAITFTFLVDTTWAAKRFFEDWMTSIINPVTRYVSYPYDYLSEIELVSLNNKDEVDRFSQDLTKWELVDTVGNVFNRLVLFNAYRYHMSMDYFGDTKENGRLFQTFFFSTER